LAEHRAAAAAAAAADGENDDPARSAVVGSGEEEARGVMLEVTRDVRDSRRHTFTADTTVAVRRPAPGTGACVTVAVTETLPAFYDVMMHSYRYASPGTPSALVADLPSFALTPGGADDAVCFGGAAPVAAPWWQWQPWQGWQAQRTQRCLGTLSWSVNVTWPAKAGDAADVQAVTASFVARKRHLHREEYPADASRGLDVPPALVAAWPCAAAVPVAWTTTRVVSDPALVTLSIPDASMPFNIITLVTSVLAFLLGSVINALVRPRAPPRPPPAKTQ
jgi:hypothetical protein